MPQGGAFENYFWPGGIALWTTETSKVQMPRGLREVLKFWIDQYVMRLILATAPIEINDLTDMAYLSHQDYLSPQIQVLNPLFQNITNGHKLAVMNAMFEFPETFWNFYSFWGLLKDQIYALHSLLLAK